MAERELKCLRCGTEMKFREKTYLGLSDTGFGNWGQGFLLVEIYACPGCGKLEFFRPGIGVPKEESGEAPAYDGPDPSGFYTPGVARDIKCYQCGRMHPADDPFCPLCGMPTVKPEERDAEPQLCNWCGAELEDDEDICPRCGLKQTF